MFALYFQHSDGRLEWINGCDNEQDVYQGINDTVARFNAAKKGKAFKIYYIRQWTIGNNLTEYDVGSHSEFFIVEKE